MDHTTLFYLGYEKIQLFYDILCTVIDQPEFYQISLASGFWNELAQVCACECRGPTKHQDTNGNFETFTVGFVKFDPFVS